MTDDGWTVTPKPSPPELREGFVPTWYDERDDYRRGLMEPVLKRLDNATLEQLSVLLGGYPIVPSDD